ncbi:xanthine dehydrogenase molybdenum binding subunit apoprotein [Breoghania corrubedonensis]|uniref:Xanthine dehydrogenase molybdenum binding subunit apoprotein n=1 Tax=Breoghania corrubedonensis TaxID=665038 RepID=A0A2T5VBD4_9HYPH|nr:molybdopterin cofactor-binding domain-containing protein [Breoghania corrubedonensis]PTW61068.1 xanthine dehydrogenase molybdenum binding subunit apoprotein [Breoghania corrubedonensis]
MSLRVAEKLSGRFRYLADDAPKGALVGLVLRSAHPHARISRLDTRAAEAVPGVHAVVTTADVPAGFRFGLRLKDQPVLADGVVRHLGEAVAAVAAETMEIAAAALAAIDVDYEILPPVTDPHVALGKEAVALHDGGNLCHAFDYLKGDVAVALEASAHTVDLSLDTPRQMHVALELEGGVAIPGEGDLVLRAPAHDPHHVRHVLSELTGLEEENIHVVGSPIGGSYGGKEDLHVQPVLALLGLKARRPVRLVLSRPEAVAAGIKRHPFSIRLRAGCNADGRLTALDFDAVADTGAYASHGPEVLETAMECAPGAYDWPSVRLAGRLAYTNNGISGAFRGFGAVQTQSALELAIDALADKAGVDRIAFRRLNLAAAEGPGPLGQTMVPMLELEPLGEALAALPAVPVGRPDERFVAGTGVALIRKGEGFGGGGPNGALGRLALGFDGRIRLETSLTEMGQGLEAAALAALRQAFGVDGRDVGLRIGETAVGNSGPTSASRGTQIAVRLVRKGAETMRQALGAAAARKLGGAAEDYISGPGGMFRADDRRNRPDIGFAALAEGEDIAVDVEIEPIETHLDGLACHTLFTACAARAFILVDRWTGRITCTGIDVLPACGMPLVPAAFDGQMAGGAAQALGFCLTEDLLATDGSFAARNLDGYFVPTIADMPPVRIHPLVELDARDPVGLRGAGEIGLNAVAPAIACAVRDVLGIPPLRLPVDPDWVLDVLEARR